MSEVPRIFTITEGPTDVVVIRSVLESLGMRYTLTTLQPEGDGLNGPVQSEVGYGWRDGVRAYCQALAEVVELSLMQGVVIVHVDADVARKNTADFDRSLKRDCPPARDTCDEVRTEILSWLSISPPPANLVLCVPAQSIDAWVVVALDPKILEAAWWKSMRSRSTNRERKKLDALGAGALFECRPDPEGHLKSVGLQKTPPSFDKARDRIKQGWEHARNLPEALRFEHELSSALEHAPPVS